ncbi:glycine betaine ABC transporter substrate-binding protein [Lipingzhangella sp. LS1_29]|uniref:Glycine betaine ABC transporter substrate-binding protein n=1 Tax=Lipingzhangella rawalii TaxID=2055835 RepID=A0ABU2H8E1_9ACTN|nr:glycine betaine ABC transporter substrate-binding protein [Lipingzhangella rawalii]MDS1271576.1 glycine betaine ABC transporter substrate-binding protein [Lipingzhangella rawalii]
MRLTKRNSRLTALGAAVASVSLLATACNGADEEVATGPEEDVGEGQEISIGLIPWEEAIAVTHLWSVILEEKGYDVSIEELDVAPTFQGVAQGDVDLFLDTWLPDTHGEYMDEYGEDIEELGAWYDDATLHLTVPEYVDEVDSIADLADNADLFDNQIVGIESGSGLAQLTNDEVMPTYGLDDDFTHDESSTAGMLTELDSAIAAEEPIVVTLWRPHPAYAEYDLKDLEDPEGTLGEGETLESIARDGFSDDAPEVAEWLGDFNLSPDEIAELTNLVVNEHEGDEEEGARVWLQDNTDFLDRTLGDHADDINLN